MNPVIPLPYRMIFAIATKSSVYLYDTQQRIPFGLISNIHYTRLTDITWSNDGKILMVSSTDGYCSIIHFGDDELGSVYTEKSIQEIIAIKSKKDSLPKKKKKKTRKSVAAVATATTSVASNDKKEEKENDDKMEVDVPIETNALKNIPESIKELIPVDKIIKSNEQFSPEKQPGSPVTQITHLIRKCPRVADELKELNDNDIKSTPSKCEATTNVTTTPKGLSSHHSKTPNRIEIRRFPRTMLQPATNTPLAGDAAAKVDNSEWPKPIIADSPMERKMHENNSVKMTASPKTPGGRRVELHTITPKSKKKLL
jgi:chromatin assembly factor 1 subunit B